MTERFGQEMGMEFASGDVTAKPYSERRLIVVERDESVDIVQRGENDKGAKKLLFHTMGVVSKKSLVGLLGGGATLAAYYLWEARNRADRVDLPLLVVKESHAETLSFPIGHPLPSVVYVGDPIVARDYYPIASFHIRLFEGKVAEALRLLGGLGASEIVIDYVEGFTKGSVIDFSLDLPAAANVDMGSEAKRRNASHSAASITWHLSPTVPPHIPDDLSWFSSEPLWQVVANARLESGLREFEIDVNYTDDFGVDSHLKAKIDKVGLGVGGQFTEFRETKWKLRVTFAD